MSPDPKQNPRAVLALINEQDWSKGTSNRTAFDVLGLLNVFAWLEAFVLHLIQMVFHVGAVSEQKTFPF